MMIVMLAAALPAVALGQTHTADFNGASPLSGWTTTGSVTTDSTRYRGTSGASMKVVPGATAKWILRSEDGSGALDLWYYEDGTQRSDPTIRSNGPLMGVITKGGRVLTVGPVYAPYLSGNSSYAASEYTPASESPWFKVTHLAINRTVGWHRWTFDFDATEGMRLLHNGTHITRYAWYNSDVADGFVGVAIIGDSNLTEGQTAWIDDVSVTLGGPMEVTPFETLVPRDDPVVEGPAPTIVPELAGVHPRLLFGHTDVDSFKAFVQTPRGQKFLSAFNSYLGSSTVPTNTNFLTDATDGQRQGFWKLPTVALNYVLTGSQTSYDRTVEFMQFLMDLEHWETSELDCGMSAGNIMIGAALAYDWLYNDLDPTFREQFRQKIWQHARRMYYLGHLEGAPNTTAYWQQDPQNNHRWHRNAGFALCALAAATGDNSEKWLMTRLAEELDFVAEWLPEDGTSHESPGYMIFGAAHLTLAHQAADRCLGTNHLEQPFFQNLNRYMIQMMSPGLTYRFAYGDQGGVNVGSLGYDVFTLKAAGQHNQSDAIGVIDTIVDRHGVAVTTAWLGIVWYPPNLAKGSLQNIPDHDFLPDLGLLTMRESWNAGNVSAMFKCSPFGGYTLNRYRIDYSYTYVNVAHDDPDANSFIILGDNGYLAETSRYSYSKKSANHNTILVNGLGQVPRGRTEGGQWTQPATGSNSMHDIAVVTSMARNGRNVVIEGEAADSYPAYTSGSLSRPALTRFRRIFAYVEGKYVLSVDDLRAPSTVDFNWLMQAPTMDTVSSTNNRYRLRNGIDSAEFNVVSDRPLSVQIITSPADHRGTILGWKQLRLTANGTTARIAAVFDPWNRSNVLVNLQTHDASTATITVTGPGFTDTWTWRAGAGKFDPSTFIGRTSSGQIILDMTDAEPETRHLLSQISGQLSPVVGGWKAIGTTAGQEAIVPLISDYVEARPDNLRQFKVSFSAPLDPATINSSAVTIVGQTGGSQSSRIGSVQLIDDTTILVTMAQDLPNADWYTITVASSVRGADGSTLVGTRSVRFGLLAGDVNGSGTVDVTDMAIVRSLSGLGDQSITIPAGVDATSAARSDLDGSGTVTGNDLRLLRRLLGSQLP